VGAGACCRCRWGIDLFSLGRVGADEIVVHLLLYCSIPRLRRDDRLVVKIGGSRQDDDEEVTELKGQTSKRHECGVARLSCLLLRFGADGRLRKIIGQRKRASCGTGGNLT
jgi:hypothetical protein